MYRQGDVLLIPVAQHQVPDHTRLLPRDAAGRLVLALGETTGHAHAISAPDAELLVDQDDVDQDDDDVDRRFLRIVSEALLTHEEHDAIPLPAGYYQVVRQREYTPETARYVAD